jgi:hypothetical protein
MPKFQSTAYYDEKTVQKIADNTVVAYPSKRGCTKKPRNGPVVVTHWYDGIDPLLLAYVRKHKIHWRRIEVVSPTELIIHER